jgi:hypothetical protein
MIQTRITAADRLFSPSAFSTTSTSAVAVSPNLLLTLQRPFDFAQGDSSCRL